MPMSQANPSKPNGIVWVDKHFAHRIAFQSCYLVWRHQFQSSHELSTSQQLLTQKLPAHLLYRDSGYHGTKICRILRYPISVGLLILYELPTNSSQSSQLMTNNQKQYASNDGPTPQTDTYKHTVLSCAWCYRYSNYHHSHVSSHTTIKSLPKYIHFPL